MKHWQKELPLNILELQYETLVENPKEKIPEIIDFCGLTWDDRCMEFYKNRRAVQTPRLFSSKRKNEYKIKRQMEKI